MESMSPRSLHIPDPWFQILSRCWLVILLLPRVSALCYFPDGTRLFADQPCIGNGTEDSFCCGPQATCMSDKLCWDGGTGFVRGSCTDVTWKSAACPQFCLTPRDGAGVMTDCKDPDSDSWCCSDGGKSCDCSKSNVTFPGARSLVSTIPYPKSSATSSTSRSSTADASSSSSFSASPSASSASSSATSSSSSPDSQAKTSTSATSPGTPAAASTPVPKSNSTNIGAAVGAPVAVVSVAFIILLWWFLRYRRHTNRKLRELQEQVGAREAYTEKPPQLPGQLPHLLEMSATERTHEMGEGRSHELPVVLAS